VRLLPLLLLSGCVGIATEPQGIVPLPVEDAGTTRPDAGQPVTQTPDASVLIDAGTHDAGQPVVDAGVFIDAGTPDAGSGRVPIFIGHGKLGRTMVSCDDGRTWIANTSENQTARCWDTSAAQNIECDHNPWSSVGMLAAGGYFFATYGWGYPGVVRRTEDGIHWTDVLPGHTFAGMAYGNGRIMANDHAPWVSTTSGATGTWSKVADITSTGWTVRRIGFVLGVGSGLGRFIITLEDEIQISDDNGASWKAVPNVPMGCAKGVSTILHGNGVTLIAQGDGVVCRSTDRGSTWTRVPVAGSFSSNAVFNNGAFFLWSGAMRYRSTDGETWVSTAGNAGVDIGPVAVSDDGTFVATRGGWQVWYDKQKFFRSTDGITWDTLPPTAFVASHPITSFVFGYAKPSAECPLP